jgi:hypothetical protein
MLTMAKTWFEDRTALPNGVYVHGRSNRDDLNTGYVIQCTQDWTTAENYGAQSIWVIAANESTSILDLSNENTHEEVRAAFQEAYEDGSLPGDLDNYCQFIENWDEVNLNPREIVDGAEWFDVPAFVQWLYETYACDMVLLSAQISRGGSNSMAAVINPDNVNAVRVS